jgi:hypothetical protein
VSDLDLEDNEQLSMWQDILDEVIAGRVSGHRCPFCEDTTIVAEADEYFISVKCTSCGRWIEGQLR